MTHEATFEEILSKSKKEAIIPFLQSLDEADRKKLAKCIKKSNKHYLQVVQVNNSTIGSNWERLANDAQRNILEAANVVCCDYNVVRREIYWLGFEGLDKILPWYVPKWFDKYIIDEAKSEWTSFTDYLKLLEYHQLGYIGIDIPENLIASSLVGTAFDDLLKHEQTTSQHIWTLFGYECGQNFYTETWYDIDEYENAKPCKTSDGRDAPFRWYGYFADLIHLEKIPRERVLVESLAASHGHLNKALLCWFAGLFEFLEPTHDELISLQENLFAVFQSTHSKPVNIALKHLAKIAKEDAFQADEFLNHVPQLFASTVKATHNATFKVLNVLVKNKQHQQAVVHATANALFISDAATQSKAVKLIAKYGNTDDTELADSLSLYADTMLSQSKQDLADFLGDDNAIAELPETLTFDNELTQIKHVESFDDLVFLLPSVFENNHICDYELALDGLVRFQNELVPENFEKLTPAFTASYKYLRTPEWDTEEYLRMFAILLVDLLRKLVQDFPKDTLLKALDEQFIKQYQKEDWRFCIETENLESCLKNCYVKYDGLKKLKYADIFWKFAACKQRLQKNISLGFLSTPTHEPSFIEPMTFLDRVKAHQAHDCALHTYDFQQCFYRVIRDEFHENQQVKAFIENELTGEPQAVLRFFYDGTITQKDVTSHPEWWMTASLILSPKQHHDELSSITYHRVPRELLSGHIPWHITEHKHTYEDIDRRTQEKKQVEVVSYHVEFEYPETKHLIVGESWYDGIYYFETENSQLLIEQILKPLGLRRSKYVYLGSCLLNQFNHISRAYISSEFVASDVYDVEPTKNLEAIIKMLNELPQPFVKNENLLFVKTMLCDVKALRQFAAEMWIRRLPTIDNKQLGHILGRLEAEEHAPLKRFTDLIQDNMLHVSQAHNQALQTLIVALLAELPEKPVKGLKKLLEILVEVLEANHTQLQAVASSKLISLLTAWQKVANLKKATKKLLEKS